MALGRSPPLHREGISQGVLCHEEERLQETLLTLYFPSWSSKRGFSTSVDRSIATYTIGFPTARIVTYVLPAVFKTLFPLLKSI